MSSASVAVGGRVIARIDRGLLLLVGFGHLDQDTDFSRAARRVLDLRVFADDRLRLNRSSIEVGAEVLAVPQFTLYARTNRGRRPDFADAMEADAARRCFDEFVGALRQSGAGSVPTGRFGADMAVASVNDGPLTLLLEY